MRLLLLTSNLLSAVVTTWFVIAYFHPDTKNQPNISDQRKLQTSCGEDTMFACQCLVEPVQYTTVGSNDWPSEDVWQSELGSLLSPQARLLNNMNSQNEYFDLCDEDADGFDFMGEGKGVCMIEQACRYRFCNRDGNQESAIAAYTVDVRTPQDIEECFRFANKHNIVVSVKTTGHNYVGASAVGSSLNIWMYHYPKDDFIDTNFQDSCGSDPVTTIAVGGGELTNDVLNAARDYTLVTGDHRSVGFVGFVVGVGVAYTSRFHGAGVDLVKRFEVVLPNATQVVADACTNPDLFWALRGGGGGTFGVVTKMHYQLLPKEQITEVYFGVKDDRRQSVLEFMTWWTQFSPQADRRVAGGFWLPKKMVLYIIGDRDVAREVIANDLEDWFDNVYSGQGEWEFTDIPGGWYEVMDGDDGYFDKFNDNPEGDGAGDDICTRLVPLSFILENKEAVINFLVDLYWNIENFDCYYFGQAMAEVAGDATSVHPAMRDAAWAISTNTRDGNRFVRDFLPNTVTGVSYNHHSPEEPDWRDALWGSNYPRLLSIKKSVDPWHRMNCWHCVGYQGPEYSFN